MHEMCVCTRLIIDEKERKKENAENKFYIFILYMTILLLEIPRV